MIYKSATESTEWLQLFCLPRDWASMLPQASQPKHSTGWLGVPGQWCITMALFSISRHQHSALVRTQPPKYAQQARQAQHTPAHFNWQFHSNKSTLTLYKTERNLITTAIFFVAYFPVFALPLHRANHCLNLPLNECPPLTALYSSTRDCATRTESINQGDSLVTSRDEDKLRVTSFTYQHLPLANGEACLCGILWP